MEAVRRKWTDERLDDLNGKVGDGFRRVDARLDSMQQTMVHGIVGIMGAMVAGFVTMAGLIVTQL